ncbi:MAG TPA: DUF6164 family protein [Wenzhouxiangella sp.]
MKKRLLLNLRNVPDDEVDEVLALLTEHHIEHYVTPAGPFGISGGGIWVRDIEDCDRAKALFDEYQEQRAVRAADEKAKAKARGEQESVWSLWRRRPGHVALMLILSAMILMIFFAPMLQIAQSVR